MTIRWTIRARVTKKDEIKSYSNAKGAGKRLGFDIADESSQMRVTAWQEQADRFAVQQSVSTIARFNALIEEGKIYYFSKAQIKMANKKFTSIRNDYEMTLGAHSEIVECKVTHVNIPKIIFDPTSIDRLVDTKDELVGWQPSTFDDHRADVVGILTKVGDETQLTARDGRELTKRDLTLRDDSNAEVTLTLWEDQAKNFRSPAEACTVMAIKGCTVKKFQVIIIKSSGLDHQGGISISANLGSKIDFNPDEKNAERVRAWWVREGSTKTISSVSTTKTVG